MSAGAATAETPGQALRRELMAAIEALNPDRAVPFRSPRARLYNLLVLHYIEGMTVQEAAHELGISRRQAHRDLIEGEQSGATMLWTRRARGAPGTTAAPMPVSPETALDALETHPQAQDIRQLIEHALEAVQQQAERRQTEFHSDLPPDPAIVLADPVMARQILVNTLSHVVSQSAATPIQLRLTRSGTQALLLISYHPEAAAPAPPLNPVVAQLARRLAWQIEQTHLLNGERTMTVQMAAAGPSILVIDDNAGFLELMETYLDGHVRQVLTTRRGREALVMLQDTSQDSAAPDAIVLDVMMPDMDGWEFLQRLRHHPQTASIPVIVCSVINNPDLAYSLGASAVLAKGISQQDILAALQQAGVL